MLYKYWHEFFYTRIIQTERAIVALQLSSLNNFLKNDWAPHYVLLLQVVPKHTLCDATVDANGHEAGPINYSCDALSFELFVKALDKTIGETDLGT